MRATPIAAIVLAMAMSPLVLAQTTGQTTTPPAATSPASPAPAQGTLQQGQAARDVDRMSDDDRTRARTRLGVGTTATGNMPDRASASMSQVSVDNLEEMDAYNTQGEKVGEVEKIVGGTGNQRYVVIAEGGFFGMGEDHAALPLDRFWVQGDRLIVQGITDDDIDAMGNYRGNTGDYQEVDDKEMIDVATWPQS